MPKPSAKYTSEIFIRPCEQATSSSWIIFDTAGAAPLVKLSELPGLFLPECRLDLNRIEMLFAELKTASTPPNLPEQAIDDALELLSDLSSNAPTTANTPDMLESRIAGCQSAIGSARD
jgi:transposase